MKLPRVCAAVLALSAALSEPAWAGEMDNRAMNQWIASAAPVSQHLRLQQMAGQWRVRQRDWRGGTSPWNDAPGRAIWRPILGGRFMELELVTSLRNHPYHGFGLLGFDRESGKYVGTWMDDFGTSLLPLVGDWDEGTNTLTLKGYIGAQADPRTQWVMKEIWRDKNHMTIEWWGPTSAGTTSKVVQVDYTRVSA